MKRIFTILGLLLALGARAVIWTGPNEPGSGGGGGGVSASQVLTMISTNQSAFVTVSTKGIANGQSAIANNGANFGPDTAGTVTGGLQEALNQLPTGTEFGPRAVGLHVKITGDYLYYTNPIVVSNMYTTALRIEGDTMLNTKLVFAGRNINTNCIFIRGGGNHNSDPSFGTSIDCPMHVEISHIGFSSLSNAQNVLLCVTNISYAKIESCNFEEWQYMTNQVNGSGMSIQVLNPEAPGLVGLAIGNIQDHAVFIEDCFFAGLATGGYYTTDHLYIRGLKFANIGLGPLGTAATLWPNTSHFSLGAAVLRRQGLDTHIDWPHFYTVAAGFVYLNADSVGESIYINQPVLELCDVPLAAINTNAAFFIDADPSAIQEISTKRIDVDEDDEFSYQPGTIRPRYVVYSTTGVSLKTTGKVTASGFTNTALSDVIGYFDANGNVTALNIGDNLTLNTSTKTLSATGGGSGPALLNTVTWTPKWKEATVHVAGDNYAKSWTQFATEYPPDTAFESVSLANQGLTEVLNLNTLEAVQEILINGNPDLSGTIDIGHLSLLETFHCHGSDGLTAILLSSDTALLDLNIGGTGINFGSMVDLVDCTALTSFAAQGCDMSGGLDLSFAPNLNYVQLNACSMSQSEVNAVLVAVESFGTSGGTIIINNNAAPSGAGATAKTALEGRSWSVTSD